MNPPRLMRRERETIRAVRQLVNDFIDLSGKHGGMAGE